MSLRKVIVPETVDAACLQPPPPETEHMRLTGQTMGTTWSITAYCPPERSPEEIHNAIATVFADIIAQMSHWVPNSLICRFNHAPAGTIYQLPEEFYTVLDAALKVAGQTAGAFNPCLYDEVNALGFGPVEDAPVAPHMAANNWRRLTLDNSTQSVTQPGACRLDLSAIAKGYAVDRMAFTLKKHSIESFLAEIGGEFVAGNVKPDLTPWWVALEAPNSAENPAIAALCGGAMATSGDTKRFRGNDDNRISHIIASPKLETTNGDFASVTVLAASCMMADAWATALFAMGDTRGREFADAHNLPALFQYRNRPSIASRTMAKRMEED